MFSCVLKYKKSFFLFFLGLTIFMILGNLSLSLNVPFKKVVNSGPALAFVSYPTVIAKIFGPGRGWICGAIALSVFFFVMLQALGIGSVSTSTSSIETTLAKWMSSIKWSNLNNRFFKFLIESTPAFLICVIGWFLGLVYITPVSFTVVCKIV